MKIARTILLSALLFASASAANAGATDINSRVYRPIEGLSYNFGSKLAVGYFLQKDGTCALNLFLAENTGDDTGPSAARLQFKVAPAESIKINSVEGQALEIKCGDGGATLEVRGGSIPARYVSR
jgi:hypothetical protein